MAKKMTKQQKSVFTMFAVVSIIALSTYFGIGFRGDVSGVTDNGIQIGLAGLALSDNVYFDDVSQGVFNDAFYGDVAYVNTVATDGSSSEFLYYDDGYFNNEKFYDHGYFESGLGELATDSSSRNFKFDLDTDNNGMGNVFGSMDDIFFDGITDEDIQKQDYLIRDYEDDVMYSCVVYGDKIYATVRLGIQTDSQLECSNALDYGPISEYSMVDLVCNINLEGLLHGITDLGEYTNFGVSYIAIKEVNTFTSSPGNDASFWESGMHDYLHMGSAVQLETVCKDLLISDFGDINLPQEFVNFEDIFYKNLFFKVSMDGVNGVVYNSLSIAYFERTWYVDYSLEIGIMVVTATPTDDVDPERSPFNDGFIDERDTSGNWFWDMIFKMIEFTGNTGGKTVVIVVSIVVSIILVLVIYFGVKKNKLKKQTRLYNAEQKIRQMVQNNRIVAKIGEVAVATKEKASEVYGSVKTKVFKE